MIASEFVFHRLFILLLSLSVVCVACSKEKSAQQQTGATVEDSSALEEYINAPKDMAETVNQQNDERSKHLQDVFEDTSE